MDRLRVFVGDRLSGHLSRGSGGYVFDYLPDYDGPPVFLGWKLEQRQRVWKDFPAALDGLLPEGVMLEQLLAKHKLDRGDKWNQLIAVGRDMTGFVTVLPANGLEEPVGKFTPGQRSLRRVPIQPTGDALPYAASELVAFHGRHKLRMSLSGVQPKVTAVFSRKEGRFKVVEINGSYILKPSPQAFPGAAENEALTMRLARAAGIEVPHCGWLAAQDGAGVFWIERFDRWGAGNRNRIRCEDACQILEVPASWKYAGNMETLVRMIGEHCGNPKLQLVKLFQRVLFCWVTGNGDMHLKNWSLIENGTLIELAPAYDLINTKVLIDDDDECALTLDGHKSGFDRRVLVDYFGREVCGINERMIGRTLDQLKAVDWDQQIQASKLPKEAKRQYQALVRQRLGDLLEG